MNNLKTELKDVKNELEERKLRRRARIEAVEDVLGVVTLKTSGVTMLGTGLLEYISPDVIAAVLPQPLAVAGIGFGILVGRKAAKSLVDAIGHLLK